MAAKGRSLYLQRGLSSRPHSQVPTAHLAAHRIIYLTLVVMWESEAPPFSILGNTAHDPTVHVMWDSGSVPVLAEDPDYLLSKWSPFFSRYDVPLRAATDSRLASSLHS
ncbi:hypothetical protein DL546_005334 [Coniochaeta pulveracea]|uniref:Uncharacterized protein n=1 Tax=Coniochaeta pulveracea TaxID=177199 RepID=A0A420Y0S7_9PEZI|nr:hypothetical protein DL546_005334 [Coniochaeta pulveracea]